MKARQWSLVSKVAAVSIAIIGSVAKGRNWLPGLEFGQILSLSAFVAGVFVTVDFNLLAEKWRDGRKTVEPASAQGK